MGLRGLAARAGFWSLEVWTIFAALSAVPDKAQFAAGRAFPGVHAKEGPELLLPESGPRQAAHAVYLAIGAKRMWGMTTVFRRITSRHRHQPSTSHRLAGEHAMPQDRLAPVAALTQARGRFILL